MRISISTLTLLMSLGDTEAKETMSLYSMSNMLSAPNVISKIWTKAGYLYLTNPTRPWVRS